MFLLQLWLPLTEKRLLQLLHNCERDSVPGTFFVYADKGTSNAAADMVGVQRAICTGSWSFVYSRLELVLRTKSYVYLRRLEKRRTIIRIPVPIHAKLVIQKSLVPCTLLLLAFNLISSSTTRLHRSSQAILAGD